MYNGYLLYDGVEIINLSRTATLLRAHLPQVEVLCKAEEDALRSALGASPYAIAGAPWYRSDRPASGRFYGLFPGEIVGSENSTFSVNITELSGDGGIHSGARHGSKELRFKTIAIAADDEALSIGLAWLRDVLDNGYVDNGGLGCFDRVLKGFSSLPVTETPTDRLRTFFKAQTIESVREIRRLPTPVASMVEIEFTLSTGPWAYTNLYEVAGALSLTSGTTSHTDAAGEDCADVDSSYADYIDDPYYTGIERPPRPTVIRPPQIQDVSTWNRKTLAIPSAQYNRWGQIVPVITVRAGSAELRQLRLRFYESDHALTGCGFVGEFVIAYLPPNTTMTIDGQRKQVSVLRNGKRVPGAHLLFGSDGRPFTWPVMGKHKGYTMTSDIVPGSTGITLDLHVSIRE